MLGTLGKGGVMPVILTFDLQAADDNDHSRLQSLFERLGWQNLGGTSYRYPRLGAEPEQPIEDWLNHVIPALALFRGYLVKKPTVLSKFTLDVQTSTGFNPDTQFGKGIRAGKDVVYQPKNNQFAKKELLSYLNRKDIFPY